MAKTTFSRIRRLASAFVLVPFLASCGGGDDEAGAPEEFHVSTDTSELSWGGLDSCTAWGNSPLEVSSSLVLVQKVNVYGGTAPYTIDNSMPQVLALSTTRVDHPGDSFDIYALPGACVDPAVITVKDALNHTVTVEVTLSLDDD